MDGINPGPFHHFKVGILGGGHLGQAIARSLAGQGLEKKNLLISYRGDPHTRQKLEAQDLSMCLATNERLLQESDVVLITIRPQDILGLREAFAPGKALVVSCMAGVSMELLGRILGVKVHRMMFSGPDTILSGMGIAAMHPEHEHLKLLLRLMKLMYIKTAAESDLNIFTAGVCMPAALLVASNPAGQEQAIHRIAKEYPLLLELFAWAEKVLPHFENNLEKEAYVKRMITKGGVTDAIVRSMEGGAPLDDALRKGIARTEEISLEIRQSLIGR